VVLPAPFGPSSPKTTPASTSRSKPSSATTSPYRLRRPSASIARSRPTAGRLPAAVQAKLGARVRERDGEGFRPPRTLPSASSAGRYATRTSEVGGTITLYSVDLPFLTL